jgi:hypothetical protein
MATIYNIIILFIFVDIVMLYDIYNIDTIIIEKVKSLVIELIYSTNAITWK